MSCLFQSIGECLGLSAERVRADVVAYMREHADEEIEGLELRHWVEGAEGKGFTAYLREMSDSGTWGGGIEIDIACVLYRAAITVRYAGGSLEVSVPRPRRRIALRYTGAHYTAIHGGGDA